MCKDRIAKRESKIDHSFDNIEKQRFKEIEEDLINQVVDLKLSVIPANHSDTYVKDNTFTIDGLVNYAGLENVRVV